MSENQEQQKPTNVEEELEAKEEYSEPGPLDPQYPLLKEFADKARGTVDHARTVTMMVENVASVIDLGKKRVDALKLAAMYHDVGKMLNADAFSENQKTNNMHDGLDPYISYQLITRHVSDSVTILFTNGFPVEVIQIVMEHHGDSVLKPFFMKAKSIDPNTPEDDYRYKTPRPSSIESLILMLCDVVESTARSVFIQQGKNPEPEVLVGNIFNSLHLAGQFNEVEIKLGRLAEIQRAIIFDIEAKYHKREPYPDDESLMEDSKNAREES